jgi:phosphoribosylamine--glycine ligase
VPVADTALVGQIMDRAVTPTLAALAEREIEYRGVLYAGLMLTAEGVKVIEYNIRFGDPECEVVVPRLASDLAVHCAEAATGRLETPVEFHDDACVTVVLASEGYPAAPRTGDVIDGLDAARDLDDVMVFHAGTEPTETGVVTAGGRVLAVTALGADVAAARTRAYEAADVISWRGKYCRRDIAAAPST